MADKTLTSANSAFTMGVVGLFPIIPFEGYGADQAWSVDNVDTGEHRMGVDGKLSVGWRPVVRTITFTFEVTSPTLEYLDSIAAVEEARREKVKFNGTGVVPGAQKKYALTNGYMREYKPMSDGGTTLGPRTFQFIFEKISPAPF